jgi:hypothetical protein
MDYLSDDDAITCSELIWCLIQLQLPQSQTTQRIGLSFQICNFSHEVNAISQ